MNQERTPSELRANSEKTKGDTLNDWTQMPWPEDKPWEPTPWEPSF